MIHEIDIRNFKCFKHLHITDVRRVNVIVGENGTGKTALLEAIFFALGSTSEMVLRFRQFRGLDGRFSGVAKKIEEAIWKDYFYDLDMDQTISVVLSGNGAEARSVRIDRGSSETLVPLEESQPTNTKSAIKFHWKDASGTEREVVPIVSNTGLQFPETGEDLPDFFFFASNQTYQSTENADNRFSV
jgi:AAA15 family ATPase/GTPase